MPQNASLFFGFVAAAAAVVVVMLGVARSTTEPPQEQAAVTAQGYRLRRGWLWVLGACAVVAFGISLPAFPYGNPAKLAGTHFVVTTYQFGFDLPASVPVDAPIVFDVASRDVNHGFGIYDPQGRLVAQVQAMPDYVNHLPLTFSHRGHYTVRCLEFCGIAHHGMQGGFDVR